MRSARRLPRPMGPLLLQALGAGQGQAGLTTIPSGTVPLGEEEAVVVLVAAAVAACITMQRHCNRDTTCSSSKARQDHLGLAAIHGPLV